MINAPAMLPWEVTLAAMYGLLMVATGIWLYVRARDRRK